MCGGGGRGAPAGGQARSPQGHPQASHLCALLLRKLPGCHRLIPLLQRSCPVLLRQAPHPLSLLQSDNTQGRQAGSRGRQARSAAAA
jgi:hypothetical protein